MGVFLERENNLCFLKKRNMLHSDLLTKEEIHKSEVFEIILNVGSMTENSTTSTTTLEIFWERENNLCSSMSKRKYVVHRFVDQRRNL